jgi:hypothetical protein
MRIRVYTATNALPNGLRAHTGTENANKGMDDSHTGVGTGGGGGGAHTSEGYNRWELEHAYPYTEEFMLSIGHATTADTADASNPPARRTAG